MEIYTLELTLDKKPRENKKRIDDFLSEKGFHDVLLCPTNVEDIERCLKTRNMTPSLYAFLPYDICFSFDIGFVDEIYNLDLELQKYFKPGLLILDKKCYQNDSFEIFPKFNLNDDFEKTILGLIEIKAEGGKGYVAKYQLRKAEDYGWYGF